MDIYLTGEEVKGLEDKSFTIVKESHYERLTGRDGKERELLVVPVKLSNNEIRNWVPNRNSLKTLVMRFGSNTENWIGKKAVFKVVERQVFGEVKPVIYLE